jgi:hypothetical protein
MHDKVPTKMLPDPGKPRPGGLVHQERNEATDSEGQQTSRSPSSQSRFVSPAEFSNIRPQEVPYQNLWEVNRGQVQRANISEIG